MKTKSVPAQSSKKQSLLDRIIEDLPGIETRSDFYYFTAIACLCATFVFPPCIIATGYCVIKAKKGGSK